MAVIFKQFYEFGRFRIDTEERVLFCESKPVSLTPKVFETLLVLVEQHGRILSKEELMNRIWQDSFVEEGNLAFNVRQLRKALGDDAHAPQYLETVPRRGYRFIANVKEVLADDSALMSSRESGIVELAESNHQVTTQNAYKNGNGFVTQLQEAKEIPNVAISNQNFSNSYRSAVIVSCLAVSLFVAVFFIWRSGEGKNKDEKRNNSSEAQSYPLPKFEKLTETGQSNQAAISPDGKYVAYTRTINNQQSIWLGQLATTTESELVSPKDEHYYGLAFSPNGEYLYFVRYDEGLLSLYRVPMIGGFETKLITSLQGSFSLSPVDGRIAYVRYTFNEKRAQQCDLMVADADGKNERTLATRDNPEYFYTPAWSPDGNKLVYMVGMAQGGAQEFSIAEINVADGTLRMLSENQWFYINRLVWLSDSSGLIAVGKQRVEDITQLWFISYPNAVAQKLTNGTTDYLDISLSVDADKAVLAQATLVSDIWVANNGKADDAKPITPAIDGFCWLNDERIVFRSYSTGGSDIWTMKMDGTEQKQLTSNARVNRSPTASPDGRYIVFESNRNGKFHIWRMDADGNNQIQMTNSQGEYNPVISSDGLWIFYNSIGNRHLWKIPVEGGEATKLIDKFSLVPAISPDNKQIAFIELDEKHKYKVAVTPLSDKENPGDNQEKREFVNSKYRISVLRLQWSLENDEIFYVAEHKLFRQSLKGGEPKLFAEVKGDDFFDFDWSPNGKHFAFTRGAWKHDISLVKDFRNAIIHK